MNDWVTLLYSRNYHNTVNQLYSNNIFKNKEKKIKLNQEGDVAFPRPKF